MVNAEPVGGRSSLANEAYEAIRRMILDGKLQPGTRVTVRPIAAELDLSPTPIKSALVALERDGVLTSKLHRGFFVPELSLADMHEIYEMREGLDSIAVRRAARSESRGAISESLRQYCVRQTERLAEGDIDAYRLEDLAFHQAIWALSGNERIRKAGENLQDQMRLGNSISARQPGRGEQSVREHLAIIDAIARGDEDAAEAAARHHIRLTSDKFASSLGGQVRAQQTAHTSQTAAT
jgi:DNA-binding GntR family transcriptional regulator